MAAEAKIPASLEQESAVTRLDEKTFAANLSPSFCIGSVPNGGYVATIFLRVAKEYLTPRNQPDTIAAHWEFLNRTISGPAILAVEEAKPGRSISVLHVSLYQGNLVPQAPWISTGGGKQKSEKVVVAYLTNRSIAAEKGISYSTGWSLQPSPPPLPARFSKLLADQDPGWGALDLLIQRRVTAIQQLRFFYNRDAFAKSGSATTFDLWTCSSNGEPFTAPALGFVVDSTAAFIMEMHRPRTKDDPPAAGGALTRKTGLWYPTLAMNLEVKKALPEEGEQWLFVRTSSKQVYNGRFDVEVIVLDRAGDLVALSHHVAMIVSSEKNTANREALAGIKYKM
ncbi:thioesterase-like superfamily domain-containing protein [Trichoderma novae-zelandiae]